MVNVAERQFEVPCRAAVETAVVVLVELVYYLSVHLYVFLPMLSNQQGYAIIGALGFSRIMLIGNSTFKSIAQGISNRTLICFVVNDLI